MNDNRTDEDPDVSYVRELPVNMLFQAVSGMAIGWIVREHEMDGTDVELLADEENDCILVNIVEHERKPPERKTDGNVTELFAKEEPIATREKFIQYLLDINALVEADVEGVNKFLDQARTDGYISFDEDEDLDDDDDEDDDEETG